MKRPAFTLIELLVVIAIIGMLSTVAIFSLSQSGINARNSQRKANLVQVSKALEFFYSSNGTYPSTGGSTNWQGACSGYGSLPDSGSTAWIPNFENYIGQLPHDPNSGKVNPSSSYASCRTNAGINCYLYASDGINYKLMAYCTPEGSIPASDPFRDSVYGYAYSIFTPGAKTW